MKALRIRMQADAGSHPAASDSARNPAGAVKIVAEAIDEAGAWTIVASLRLLHAIGMETPRYWYYVGQVAYWAEALKLNRRDKVLLLGSDFTGANEIRDVRCDLVDASDEMRTLLLARLMQGALKLAAGTAPSGQAIRTIITLPGVREQDRSPFWDGLGRHFYDRDPEQSIAEFGERWHTDVAALLPQQPVIVSLLDAAAQRAIGSVDGGTVALRSALNASGFHETQHVSTYDAGPVYEHDSASDPRGAWARLEVEAVEHVGHPRAWAVLEEKVLWVVQAELVAGRLQIERSLVQPVGAHWNVVVASPLDA